MKLIIKNTDLIPTHKVFTGHPDNPERREGLFSPEGVP